MLCGGAAVVERFPCFPSSSSTGLVLYRALGLPAQPQVSRASVCLLDPSPHNLQGVTCMSMSHTAQIQAPGGVRRRKVDVMFKRESSEMVIRPQASQLPLGIEEIKHSHTHIWGNYLLEPYLLQHLHFKRLCKEAFHVLQIWADFCISHFPMNVLSVSPQRIDLQLIFIRYSIFMNMCISS